MIVQVRKNNVAKAITIWNKKIAEDGDLRRVLERQHFESKGQKRRARLARAKARQRKEDQQRREDD
jgi:ribosomal protein S21